MNEGYLPVRSLKDGIIKYFEHGNPNFAEEIFFEVKGNGLNGEFVYDNFKRPINLIAEISSNRQIKIFEPYLAFLWSLSHIILAYYYELHSQNVNFLNNSVLDRAGRAYKYGISLFKCWASWDLNIPNPEKYDLGLDPYIDKANAITIIAATFIISHEYSHHLLGHDLDSYEPTDSFREEEFDADSWAADILLKNIGLRSRDEDRSVIVGIIIGISSILFLDGCWSGMDEHSDIRVLKILEKLDGIDKDIDVWQFGFMSLIIWEGTFLNSDTFFPKYDTPKEDYLHYLKLLKDKQDCY